MFEQHSIFRNYREFSINYKIWGLFWIIEKINLKDSYRYVMIQFFVKILLHDLY